MYQDFSASKAACWQPLQSECIDETASGDPGVKGQNEPN